MGEVTYYVATSLDGFIARSDGSIDAFPWDEAVVRDFLSDIEDFETVLMGRRTYQVALDEGKTNPYPGRRQVVFSRTLTTSPDGAVEIVSGDVVSFVADLRAQPEGRIWLCGGGEIATLLAEAGLIDRMVVKLNPVIFGSGVPVMGGRSGITRLHLERSKSYDCGIIFLGYRVVSDRPTRGREP